MKMSEMMRMVEENKPAAAGAFWLLAVLAAVFAMAVLIRNMNRERAVLRQAILCACTGKPLTELKVEMQGVQETDLAPMLPAETLQRLRETEAPVAAEVKLCSWRSLLAGCPEFDVHVRCEALQVQQSARLRVVYSPQGENDPDALCIHAVQWLDAPEKEK